MQNPLIKRLVFSVSGNVIEFYDFTLFAYFATSISHLYFPSEYLLVSLLSALGVFAVSYLARPLGAIYFGALGDTWGRKRALCMSIGCMGLPTFFIALLPTYDSIGVLAPLLLTLFRIAQGFCMGGEFGSASVYLVENTPIKHQGVVCGLLNSSIVVGMLLSSFACIVCEQMETADGWRIPFLIGAAMSLACYWLRSVIGDTVPEAESRKKLPLTELASNNLKSFVAGVVISGFAGLMFYSSFVFPKISWSLANNIPRDLVGISIWLGLLTYAVGSPLFGLLVPRLGIKRLMLVGATGTMLLTPFCLGFLTSPSLSCVMLAVVTLALLSALFQVTVNLYLANSFPAHVRCIGVSLSYTTGIGLFGGTVIPLFTYLQSLSGQLLMSVYIIVFAIAVMFTVIRTSGVRNYSTLKLNS